MGVTVQNAEYTAWRERWARIRDFWAGQDEIRAKQTTYLPKPSGFDAADGSDYDGYLKRAHYLNPVESTLDLWHGLIRRKPVTYEVSDQLGTQFANIDGAGTTIDTLVSASTVEALGMGRYGVMIDLPEERTSTPTPHWATYPTESIDHWRERVVNGRRVLTMVKLVESYEVQDQADEFTMVVRVRYRVLDLDEKGLYRVRIMESGPMVDGTAGADVTLAEYYPEIRAKKIEGEIPFVLLPKALSMCVTRPPVLSIVNLAWASYMLGADYRHGLFWASNPTPWVAGKNIRTTDEHNKPISYRMGATSAWNLGEGGSCGMNEFSGAGAGAQRDALRDFKQDMANLGAELILEDSSAPETAHAVSVKTTGRRSKLSTLAGRISEGLTQCARWHARFAGEADEQIAKTSIRLNQDFVESRMDPAELAALVKARQERAISAKVFRYNIQRGELLPDGHTPEMEVEELAREAKTPTLDEVPVEKLRQSLIEHSAAGAIIPPSMYEEVLRREGWPKHVISDYMALLETKEEEPPRIPEDEETPPVPPAPPVEQQREQEEAA